MSVPTSVQLFNAFLGTQEGIHSIILPDIFSSGGSRNVFIDKYGRVRRIGGYDNNNSSAFTTAGGASASMIRGLIPYRGTGGGTTVRKLIIALDDQVNEFEFHVSTDNGATSSLLEDLGSGSINSIPDAAQFGDIVYLTNGVVQPRRYNGTTFATTGLTRSPTPTSAASSNSGNLKGNYTYKLVSFIDGVRQYGSASSTNLTVVDKQVDLSWTADADTNVDGYEIYRTTGTGTTFYYLTTIGLRTTVAYTDNLSDITLLEQRVLEEHGDPPAITYYCEPHKQRMWWLRTDAAPTRGYWSDAGIPESVYTQNFLDFSDSETVGDVIVGALGNYEGLLVVFTEKAVWTVSGTGAIIGDFPDWTKTRTNASIGSVSGRSIVRIPAGSKFTDQQGQPATTPVSSVAYFTPLGDIRLFDGENDIIVSNPVKDTVIGFNYAQRRKVWALDDAANNQAIWFFPSANADEPDTAVCWNYSQGVWYVWTPMPFGHGCTLDTSTNAHVILTGQANKSTGAFVYDFFDAHASTLHNTFDGTAIDAVWMTKTLYGVNEQAQPALHNTKRWRWLDLLFKIDQDVDITVEWLEGAAPDNGAAISQTTISPSAEFLVTFDGSTILTADGSEILVSADSAQGKVLLMDSSGQAVHDTGIRLRIGTNNATGTWALEAMELAYQILPGVKRRMP